MQNQTPTSRSPADAPLRRLSNSAVEVELPREQLHASDSLSIAPPERRAYDYLAHQPIHGNVLVVDDDAVNAQLLTRLLQREGYTVQSVADGAAAIDVVAQWAPDVLLLDVQLPKIDGFEVCRRLKTDSATRLTPVIFLTGLDAREHRLEGIKAGADDFLAKPFNVEELRARVRSLVHLKHHTDELESAESVILSLALTVEARDSYTSGHCRRLAEFAVALGSELRLPYDDLEALRRGAFLHDVGKIGVPDSILLKSSRLTQEEMEVMQTHTVIGDRLCGNMRSLAPVRPIIRHHHERLDGSGYPDHLAGESVPLLAQIVGMVDAYDAITTTRQYRPARSPREACQELFDDGQRGKLSKTLTMTFVRLLADGLVERMAIQ
ncbi:MAG TPA: HD domain-containing phosphohydrolase [Gemmatimonadaceae bacterium]|nr:HD domain-containing phosphohydrolase [Gemmatimonadaceae bacterium]